MDAFTIVIHAGAGTIVPLQSYDKASLDDFGGDAEIDALSQIVSLVFQYAKANLGTDAVTAVEVVEYAVSLLEDNPIFSAGRGAAYSSLFTHEMEAAIMDGKTLQSGRN